MALFSILTLFPDVVEAYLDVGVLGLARARGIVQANVVDFRDFSRDRHRTVDDRPFGGGPGMVLKPEPIVEAVEWVEQHHGPHRRIAMTPDGRPFDQRLAEGFAAEMIARAQAVPKGTPESAPKSSAPLPPAHPTGDFSGDTSGSILLLCGRYEGFDERALQALEFERLSIGDYVLAGGELAALVIVEAIARLLPGTLGDARSAVEDSFGDSTDGGLDHPHFTRPRVFRGAEVPDVLLSGDHARIHEWRKQQSELRTKAVRPDLVPGS